MSVSPTPESLESVHNNKRESCKNGSLNVKTPGNYVLDSWKEILFLLIFLVGLVGNSLVLWLLGFRIKRNPISVYILNLAAADALYLCSTFIFIMNYFLNDVYFPLFKKGLLFLRFMFYLVGLSLLAAISSERCLSVLFPIWYRCHRPKNMSATVCTVVWALAGLLEVTYFVLCNFVDRDHLCTYISKLEFVGFLLLTPVMCMSSLILMLRVQCSSQRRQPPRFYQLVLLNFLIFLLFGVPLGIIEFLLLYNLSLPLWLPELLACVNSSVNPFIYFFLGRQRHKRRESLRVILQRALGDKQDSRGW